MRFSIKWLLAAIAYVALAAAAATAEYGMLADAPWAVLLLCFCYSLILIGVASGERHARAVGFAVACAAHFAVIHTVADRTPAALVLEFAGYSVTSQGRVIEDAGEIDVPGARGLGLGPIQGVRTAKGMGPILNSGNAISMLASGLIGGYLGALVFRRDGHGPPI